MIQNLKFPYSGKNILRKPLHAVNDNMHYWLAETHDFK